eukprot:g21532.t1
MLNFKELHKLNAKLKALCHVQKELIANLEAQAILKNEDRESMMCVNDWQDCKFSLSKYRALPSEDNLLMFWKDHINNSYDHPKRSWHEPEGLEGPEGFQPEDEGKLGEVALTKSYENLMLELTEMSAELILYNEEARETSLQELAISVRAGWKAAFILRHGSAVPLQTTLSPADRMEFTFVEWLFARSLARHRQARDPSLWGPVPSVKLPPSVRNQLEAVQSWPLCLTRSVLLLAAPTQFRSQDIRRYLKNLTIGPDSIDRV